MTNWDLDEAGDRFQKVLTASGINQALARSGIEPGDVITTGTPAGVGAGFSPTKFLAVGDQIRVEINGLGRIEHGVIAR